ncbi:hypothetical protein Sango_2115100 [Sesamum angolense]|uniref:Reverse transcriptase Ty1/copia-type domain-containing protein n=1 Tax=Sesamum angolense TaxID=2727404 RepID=A0AAE1WBZ3_9LAMI|nr:hypothetical protein Sango_2115100 [Sesamum angolense]
MEAGAKAFSRRNSMLRRKTHIALTEVTTQSLSVMMSELLLIMEANAQLKQAQVSRDVVLHEGFFPYKDALATEDMITEVKQYLDHLFTTKDFGITKYFSGLEIDRCTQGIAVTQTKYIKDIVADTGMLDARSATAPFPRGIKVIGEAGAKLTHLDTYRRLASRILYLNLTRPGTSYACQQLSQYLQHPCQQHLDATLHLVRYLDGSIHEGLFFPCKNALQLKVYSGADCDSYIGTRWSLTSYCIFLGDAIISWKIKKQNTVSCLIAEVEYRSMRSIIVILFETSSNLASLPVWSFVLLVAAKLALVDFNPSPTCRGCEIATPSSPAILEKVA